MVDVDFAQDQVRLMLRDSYIHPNGQIPAYEWNFGDVNPPVYAFATLFNFVIDRSRGETDQRCIKNAFSRQFRTLTPEDILHPGRGQQSAAQVDAAAAAQVWHRRAATGRPRLPRRCGKRSAEQDGLGRQPTRSRR